MSEQAPDGEYTQLDLIRREEKAFQKFAAICKANEDAVNIPKIYYDIADGDHAAAAVLDEILFWTLPNKKRDSTALRVRKDGILWLAVSRAEWWERKRLSERQADRGIEKLLDLGLIDKSIHRFNGHGQMHLRVIGKVFFDLYGKALHKAYLEDADRGEDAITEINDLYEMMGMSDSRIRDLRNGDTDSRNGDRESPNGNTLNSLQPASNQPPDFNNKSPIELEFIAHFGSFNGDREIKRWCILAEAIGLERLQTIADWAERNEIHMTNRGRLLDSMETAAKKWTDPKPAAKVQQDKGSRADFFEKLARA